MSSAASEKNTAAGLRSVKPGGLAATSACGAPAYATAALLDSDEHTCPPLALGWLQTPDETDHLAQDAEVALIGPDHDGLHGRMLGPQHDQASFAAEAFDRGFALQQGRDDVAGAGGVLLPHEDQVAVGDVGVDHAVATNTQREHLLAAGRQPVGPKRNGVLPVLLRENGRAGGDAPQHGHPRRLIATVPPGHAPVGGHQGAGGALGGDPALEHSLALERPEMVERGPGREVEAVADLAHRRGHAVTVGETADELQHFPLPVGHLAQGPVLRLQKGSLLEAAWLNRMIVNTR